MSLADFKDKMGEIILTVLLTVVWFNRVQIWQTANQMVKLHVLSKKNRDILYKILSHNRFRLPVSMGLAFVLVNDGQYIPECNDRRQHCLYRSLFQRYNLLLHHTRG